jgi:hypothetical protein
MLRIADFAVPDRLDRPVRHRFFFRAKRFPDRGRHSRKPCCATVSPLFRPCYDRNFFTHHSLPERFSNRWNAFPTIGIFIASNHPMRNADNDNEEPFRPLGAFASAALASARPSAANLDADEKDGHGDADRKSRDEEHAKPNRNYVDHRLREISSFEEIARGVRRTAEAWRTAGVNLVKR